MNDSARRGSLRDHALILMLAAAAAAIPAVALGNPPAVGAPAIPGPFVGAPTNDDPNAGQFSVDVTNRHVGRAPERFGRLVASARYGRRQARASAEPSVAQRRAIDRVFVTFSARFEDDREPANGERGVDARRPLTAAAGR